MIGPNLSIMGLLLFLGRVGGGQWQSEKDKIILEIQGIFKTVLPYRENGKIDF